MASRYIAILNPIAIAPLFLSLAEMSRGLVQSVRAGRDGGSPKRPTLSDKSK
jgi:hypothetical protein